MNGSDRTYPIVDAAGEWVLAYTGDIGPSPEVVDDCPGACARRRPRPTGR